MKSVNPVEVGVLFPWEQEGPVKKTIGSLPPKLRRMGAVRSKPKVSGHEYLEVYIRSMEKARLAMLGRVFGRLLKETAVGWTISDKKMKQTQQRLRERPEVRR